MLGRITSNRRLSKGFNRLFLSSFSPFNPTPEHESLRQVVRTFVEAEVNHQALEFNRSETFNIKLFQKLGELGLLGVTVDTQYGGSGMDASAAVIIHGNNE